MSELFLNEYSAVGSVLIDASSLDPLRALVSEEDFQNSACRRLFHEACALRDAGERVDVGTISARCDGVPDEFLAELMDRTPTAAGVEYYGRAVHNGAVIRRAKALGSRLADTDARDPAELMSLIRAETDRWQTDSDLLSPLDRATAYLDRLRELSDGTRRQILPTGFSRLDALLGGGMQLGGMYVLAARPGVGKTTMMLQIAANLVKASKSVLICSLEMSADQLYARLLAAETGLPIQLCAVKGPGQDEKLWTRVTAGLDKLSRRPLYITDRAHMSIADIELRARNVPDLACVCIDYLGLIRHAGGGSLYEQMTRTSNAVKRMARALDVPVLCLAQLNRESERSGGVPKLSDLRDTGAVEQDADAVVLLHELDRTEDYLNIRHLRARVAKNRHGLTGELTFKTWGVNGRAEEEEN